MSEYTVFGDIIFQDELSGTFWLQNDFDFLSDKAASFTRIEDIEYIGRIQNQEDLKFYNFVKLPLFPEVNRDGSPQFVCLSKGKDTGFIMGYINEVRHDIYDFVLSDDTYARSKFLMAKEFFLHGKMNEFSEAARECEHGHSLFTKNHLMGYELHHEENKGLAEIIPLFFDKIMTQCSYHSDLKCEDFIYIDFGDGRPEVISDPVNIRQQFGNTIYNIDMNYKPQIYFYYLRASCSEFIESLEKINNREMASKIQEILVKAKNIQANIYNGISPDEPNLDL